MKRFLSLTLLMSTTIASACPGGMVKISSLSVKDAVSDLEKFQSIPNNKIYVHIAKSLYFKPKCETNPIVSGNANPFIDKSFDSEQDPEDIEWTEGYSDGYNDGYSTGYETYEGYETYKPYEDPCNPYVYEFNDKVYGNFLMGKNLISDKQYTFMKNHLMQITGFSVEVGEETGYGDPIISVLKLETKRHQLVKGVEFKSKQSNSYYAGDRFNSNEILEICSEKGLSPEEKDYGYVFSN